MATVAEGHVGTAEITLTASTVETVTFTNTDLAVVEVDNTGGSLAVWYTLDGSTPTVGGGNCWRVPGGWVDRRARQGSGSTVVKLISAGTPTIRVQGA